MVTDQTLQQRLHTPYRQLQPPSVSLRSLVQPRVQMSVDRYSRLQMASELWSMMVRTRLHVFVTHQLDGGNDIHAFLAKVPISGRRLGSVKPEQNHALPAHRGRAMVQ